MFSFFNRRTHAYLAMDLSSAAVKLIELAEQGNRYRVESYGVAAIPAGSITDHGIQEPERVAEAVSLALKRSHSTLKNVILSLPDSAAVKKQLSMDIALSEDDIEQQILLDADKYVPYSMGEMAFDFTVLSQDEESQRVQLVACRKEYIDQRVDLLKLAGLQAKVIEMESAAIERVCRILLASPDSDGDAGKAVAVVDLGSSTMVLNVIVNQRVIFTREEVFGGAQLTKDIQKHYGLSYADAGFAKKTGDLPEDYEAEVLGPFRELVVLQIKRALQFFYSTNHEQKISRLLLIGGTVSVPGFVDVIAEQLGIPSMTANPFSDMVVAKRVNANHLAKDASALLTSCGLALRSFVHG